MASSDSRMLLTRLINKVNDCEAKIKVLLDDLSLPTALPELADQIQSFKSTIYGCEKLKSNRLVYLELILSKRTLDEIIGLINEYHWYLTKERSWPLKRRPWYLKSKEKKIQDLSVKLETKLAKHTSILRTELQELRLFAIKESLEQFKKLRLDYPNGFVGSDVAGQFQSFGSIAHVSAQFLSTQRDKANGNKAIEDELRLSEQTLIDLLEFLPTVKMFGEGQPISEHDKKLDQFQDRLAAHTSKLRLLPNAKNVNRDIVFVVMGVSEPGHSRFIRQILESDSVTINRTLDSAPPDVKAYLITVENCTITLINAPLNKELTPLSVRRTRLWSDKLLEWLSNTYRSPTTLYEVIWTHEITDDDVDMEKSFWQSSELLKYRLLGLCEATLVTICPNHLGQGSIDFVEEVWLESFTLGYRPMYARLPEQESALTIIKRILFGQKIGQTAEDPLGIQEENLDPERSLEPASPKTAQIRSQERMRQYKMTYYNKGKSQPVQAEHSDISELEKPRPAEKMKQQQQQQQQQQHKNQHVQLARGNEKARISLEGETDKLEEKAISIDDGVSASKTREMTQHQDEEQDSGNEKEGVSSEAESYKVEEKGTPVGKGSAREMEEEKQRNDHQRILVASAIKEKKMQSESGKLIASLTELGPFAFTHLRDLQKLLQSLSTHRLLRPGLQKGYSRIEWTCSCGDLLYGDFIERNQGSLQALAARLGGRVISGPAAQGSPPNTSNVPTVPPQAHLTGQPVGSVSAGGFGPHSGSDQQSNIPAQPSAESGSLNPTIVQERPRDPKWLELCIRSSPDTYVLGEIDVAGTQTDQTVFNKIRAEYDLRRSSAKFFGRFALKVPNGGVFVQFRKDKLRASGRPATASIMNRPSVPKPQEAQAFKYVFEPVPMDEPPMDTRTFNHYFHKPHLADGAETWIKRFPQLTGPSLFYSTKKLAKGWGIEITEDRNWTLFVLANTIALLLSGVIAGVSSIYMNDKQTGVAIGAWLSTIETLVVTALFWHGTNV